jgi:type I restriction enzyme R subunit
MSQSPEKTGVETPAIESLVKLGYTHLPGHTVQVEHRHLPQYLRMCCIPGY